MFVVTGSASGPDGDALGLCETGLTGEWRHWVHLGLLTPHYWSHGWVALWCTSCAIGVLLFDAQDKQLKGVAETSELPHWWVVSGLVALAISGAVAKDRVISRYVAEHVTRGSNDCVTNWHLLESYANRVIDYWFSLPWMDCVRTPMAMKMSAWVLVASASVAFLCVAVRRFRAFQRKLILGTQMIGGSIALLCLADVIRRHHSILEEGGTLGDSLPLMKLEGFAFLLSCLVLCSFSMVFSRSQLQRLLWLPPLLGGLPAVRYLAEDSTREAFYWPSTTLPQLEHLSQDRWYLAAAAISLVLVQLPSRPIRAQWRNIMLAVPAIILATVALVVAERAMAEAWTVKCLTWQEPQLRESCAPK
jgi:hypothetical protein